MVIVAAVDRSDRASLVVEEAQSLARAYDDTIHIVHVLSRSEFVDLGRTATKEPGGSISMDRIKEVATDIAAEAATDLEISHEAIGIIGDPADRIVEYAAEQDARYIVVAGRKRSPTEKAVFGSVAQSILLNSKSPVVTVIE